MPRACVTRLTEVPDLAGPYQCVSAAIPEAAAAAVDGWVSRALLR